MQAHVGDVALGRPSLCASCFLSVVFFNDTATTEIYTLSYTLSLHDALPISAVRLCLRGDRAFLMRTWLSCFCLFACSNARSEEHTSELQSHSEISYAVF